MPCEERARLERERTVAGRVFDDARAILQAKIHISSRGAYRLLLHKVDRAQDHVKRTHAALNTHIRDHNCAETEANG